MDVWKGWPKLWEMVFGGLINSTFSPKIMKNRGFNIVTFFLSRASLLKSYIGCQYCVFFGVTNCFFFVLHSLATSLKFCMILDISQTKNSSRENPKIFDRHLGFWHSRMKRESLSLKYHVIPLFIGFCGWQIQWWHYFGDSLQMRRVTSI